MDPLSIAASIAGIVGVCLQAAGSLDALRSKFQHAQVTITALASQCRAIKTGLSRLQMVTVQNHAIRNQDDIIHTMDTTLTGCMVVLSCFDNTLEKLCKAGTGAKRSLITRWRNKARVVWNEDEMKGYISLLQGQQSSVAFLVQLLQMDSIDEILKGVRDRKVFLDEQVCMADSLRQAYPNVDVAVSVLGSRRTADSIFGGGAMLTGEHEFEFDDIIVNAKAYRRAMAMAEEVLSSRGPVAATSTSGSRERGLSNDQNTELRNDKGLTVESPMVSRRGPVAATSTPGSRERGFSSDQNTELRNDKGLAVESPMVSRLPIFTLDEFKVQIMQLYPQLEFNLIERFAQEQVKRYGNLMHWKHMHSAAITNQGCRSGNFCLALGGEASLYRRHKATTDLPAGLMQLQITDSSHEHEQLCILSANATTSAQFPPGVPLPPVERLPAEFECPICFEVNTFEKPSHWTKHVYDDLQPFTCSFPLCNDVKSFRRMGDWVRHENERHRRMKWWTCSYLDCSHTSYRKNEFVLHLIREHKMPDPRVRRTKYLLASEAASDSQHKPELDRLWEMVKKCRYETDPAQEPCRFCGNISSSWKELTEHLAKHMKHLAMTVLALSNDGSTESHSKNVK